MTLAYSQVEEALHREAKFHAGRNFDHWELVSEAWLVVNKLSSCKWVKRSASWAMLNYITKERQTRKRGNPRAVVVSLYPKQNEPCQKDRSLLSCITKGETNPTFKGLEQKDFMEFVWANTNEEERKILSQRFYDGLSCEEIAGSMGVSPERVYQKISVVGKRIRGLMGE